MDKRWRNLGFLVLVVVIVLSVWFLFSTKSSNDDFEVFLEKNELSKDEFSDALSSINKPLADDTIADLKNLSSKSSGDEKIFLEKILTVESQKRDVLLLTENKLSNNLEDICQNIFSYRDEIQTKMYLLEDNMLSLGSMQNGFGVDINSENIIYQSEMIPLALDDFEWTCISANLYEPEELIGG